MLVHKGTLWYAVESGRERTTLTDSRIMQRMHVLRSSGCRWQIRMLVPLV